VIEQNVHRPEGSRPVYWLGTSEQSSFIWVDPNHGELGKIHSLNSREGSFAKGVYVWRVGGGRLFRCEGKQRENDYKKHFC
jgi:hypothetical protein